MIKFESDIVPIVSERRFNYAFNVPSKRIKFVKAGLIQRKNEANMSDMEKYWFRYGIAVFNIATRSPNLGGTYCQTVAIHRCIGCIVWMVKLGRKGFCLGIGFIYQPWNIGYVISLVKITIFSSHTGIGPQTDLFQTGWRTLLPMSMFQMQNQSLLNLFGIRSMSLGLLDRILTVSFLQVKKSMQF